MAVRDAITIRVPGSTSNCGSGFDTLGLALQIYNRVSLARVGAGRKPAADGAPAAARPLVESAAAAFFGKTGRAPFGFTFRVEGEVPAGRGLGSSATVRAGVIAGLNVLADAGLSPAQVVELVAALEGHPDNAAPAVRGGFCVARTSPVTGAFLDCVRVAVPADVAFVVVAPAAEILTKESRAVLPRSIPHADAVRSINAAAFLVAAFTTGDLAKLRHAVADFVHEPYRLPGIPGARAAIDAGIAAGAFTGWLSGSGSSVLCVCETPKTPAVRRAMEAAFDQAGTARHQSWSLAADNEGLAIQCG
jgi:homoserine kinase